MKETASAERGLSHLARYRTGPPLRSLRALTPERVSLQRFFAHCVRSIHPIFGGISHAIAGSRAAYRRVAHNRTLSHPTGVRESRCGLRCHDLPSSETTLLHRD